MSSELKLIPEYGVWTAMLTRCYDPNCEAFQNYGARGITVCLRWRERRTGFKCFLEDMGSRPSKDYSIERVNNNEGYSPENCKWATRKEQCRNRRSNKLITIENTTRTLVEWCEVYSIKYSLVKDRLRDNWEITKALTTPLHKSINLQGGEKFGLWTVIVRTDDANGGKARYLCKCSCGKERKICLTDLVKNKSTQCQSCSKLGNKFAKRTKSVV